MIEWVRDVDGMHGRDGEERREEGRGKVRRGEDEMTTRTMKWPKRLGIVLYCIVLYSIVLYCMVVYFDMSILSKSDSYCVM